MKDGTRFLELRRECEEKIKKLSQENDIDYLSIKSIKKRQDIWDIFNELNNNEQVEFIDVLVKGKKLNSLKAKITRLGRPFNKSCYAPLMESSDMKQKFGKSIELSVHTWRKLIIEKLLIEYPEKRNEILLLINEIKEKIEGLNKEKSNRIEMIADNEKIIEESKRLIKTYENALSNPNTLTPELLSRLEQEEDQSNNEMFEKFEIEINHLKRDDREKTSDIENFNTTLKGLNSELQLYKTQKEKCLEEINQLEQGNHTGILYEKRNNPDDYMTLRTIKSLEIIERAFLEDRDYTDDEICHIEKVKCCDYRGELHTSVSIEKNYMLVPNDPKDREYFKNIALSGGHGSFQGFTAQLESFKYEPNYKANIAPSGKKIRYLFYMFYDSGSLPWIKITFTIPNKIFNEAEIINKTTDISTIDIKLMEIEKKIDRKNKDIEECKQEKIKISNEILNKQRLLDELKLKVELNNQKRSIEKSIVKCNETCDYLRSEIDQLKNFTELDKNLSDKEVDLKTKKTELEDYNEQFRDLSIIVLTQLETAEMLRKLSSLVAGHNYLLTNEVSAKSRSESSMKQSAIIECEKYISSYDKNIKKIEEECKIILNLVS